MSKHDLLKYINIILIDINGLNLIVKFSLTLQTEI